MPLEALAKWGKRGLAQFPPDLPAGEAGADQLLAEAKSSPITIPGWTARLAANLAPRLTNVRRGVVHR